MIKAIYIRKSLSGLMLSEYESTDIIVGSMTAYRQIWYWSKDWNLTSKQQSEGRKRSGMEWAFWNPSAYSHRHSSFIKATPPNPFQNVPLTQHQVCQYMSLWGILIQTSKHGNILQKLFSIYWMKWFWKKRNDVTMATQLKLNRCNKHFLKETIKMNT